MGKSNEFHALVSTYIDDVRSGRVVVGELERAAVLRHLSDLDSDRGDVRFNESLRRVPLVFASTLVRHYKGPLAGQLFELEGWEAFILWCLFGWQRFDKDNQEWVRRFRYAYIAMGRKNGKTFLAATIALVCMVADGEAGAEVYSAATKRDQSRLVWDAAAAIVRKDKTKTLFRSAKEGRNGLIQVNASRVAMSSNSNDSTFQALSRDSNTMDGLNPHCAIVDELHAHKSPEVYSVLRSGMGARRQPLLFAITTAGSGVEGICIEKDRQAEQILRGVIEDDSTFAFIARLDAEDDPFDESVWRKANPNLGVSVNVESLRDDARSAHQTPTYLNEYLRKRMNCWTAARKRAIDPEWWKACNLPVLLEPNAPCFMGLDLATKQDMAAACLVFPHGDDTYSVVPKFWCPEDQVATRSVMDGAPYEKWVKAGLLEATPGARIDQAAIRRWINEQGEMFGVEEVAYDSWNASQMAVWLEEDGFTIAETRQGYKSMSEPTKYLQALFKDGKVRHADHPVLRWNADNLELRFDVNDNVAPAKGDAVQKNRIDGMVAAIMGLSRALVNLPDEDYGELVVLG